MVAAPRRIAVLGATGSVGRAALRVVADSEGALAVASVAARADAQGLARVARASGARLAAIADPARLGALREALAGSGVEAVAGDEGLARALVEDVDCALIAAPGVAALAPALAALAAGRDLALANKECLACAGDLIVAAARATSARLLPVDSEHNALWRLLGAHGREGLSRAVITASGGPFREASRARMARATPRDACAHPVWSMGPKISVDSATLMNKGLELIEARALFDLAPQSLDAVIHPQGVVHAMLGYRDGAVYAHCAKADMRLAVASALCAPAPAPDAPEEATLDILASGAWSFEPIDEARFPAFALARAAMFAGGAAPASLNAANEVAVAAFLAGRIGFLDIAAVVADALDALGSAPAPASFDEARAVDARARERARRSLAARAGAAA